MNLTKKQIEVIKYSNNNKPLILILCGAVRSGKTFVNNLLFARHVMDFKRKDFIITGHTISSIERNIIEPLRQLYPSEKLYLNNRNNFELFGNKIHCFGADKSDSYQAMTGMTSYGWYANEMTLQNTNTINEAFNRCSGKGYRIFGDTNPDHPEHYVKINFVDKSGETLENGRVRIKSFHFILDDNEYLDKGYVENLKASTPQGMWYNRRILGHWVAAEGVIYENFDKDIHVIEPFKIPDDWRRIRAIDFGYKNPFACGWFAIDNDGRVYMYKDYKKTETLIVDHAKKINSFVELDEHDNKINYDVTVADHDAQERAEYEQHDVYTRAARKDVILGIQKVAERLVVQPDGKPRLYFFSNCKDTIKEIQGYVWEPKKEGKPYKEAPLKVNDHCMDLLKYAILEIDGDRIVDASSWGAGDLGL